MSEINFLTKEESEFITSKNFAKEYPKLLNTLEEPRFLISDLDVAARDATYWDKQGILPEMKGAGARRKYDFVQAIWIRLIKQMRSFGVSITIIKALKEQLLTPAFKIEDLLKHPKGLEVLRTIAKKEGNEKEFEDMLSSGELLRNAPDLSLDVFTHLVLGVIVFRKNLSLLVSDDGHYIPYSVDMHQQLYRTDSNLHLAFEIPHISLSISKAYQDLVQDWSIKPFFSDISIVTEEEKKLLKIIREPGITNVEVIFEGGKMDLLKICKEEGVTPAHRLSDIISKNGYHDIVIKTRNGKPIYYKNTILKKMKSTS